MSRFVSFRKTISCRLFDIAFRICNPKKITIWQISKHEHSMKTTRIILLILFVCLINTTYCQEGFTLNKGHIAQKNFYTIIPYVEINGKIIIEVSINKKKRKFILDTGAPLSITENLYREINPESTQKIPVTDQSGIEDSLNLVSVPIIEIGGIDFIDIPSLVINEGNLIAECYGVDGLIGSNLLRNLIIQFNSREKTIVLTDKSKLLNLKRKNSSNLYLTPHQSSPYIKIKLQKNDTTINEDVLFDTGADGFYDLSMGTYNFLSEKYVIFDRIAEGEGSYTFGLHGAAEKQQHYMLSFPALKINNFTFKNVLTNTTHDQSSRIGLDILKYGKVTLNYKDKQFYIEPFDSQKETILTDSTWSVGFTINDNKLNVGIIWDKSLEGKINIGDEVIQFDDYNYQNMDICQLLMLNERINKSSAILILKDIHTSEIKKITIKRLP